MILTEFACNAPSTIACMFAEISVLIFSRTDCAIQRLPSTGPIEIIMPFKAVISVYVRAADSTFARMPSALHLHLVCTDNCGFELRRALPDYFYFTPMFWVLCVASVSNAAWIIS